MNRNRSESRCLYGYQSRILHRKAVKVSHRCEMFSRTLQATECARDFSHPIVAHERTKWSRFALQPRKSLMLAQPSMCLRGSGTLRREALLPIAVPSYDNNANVSSRNCESHRSPSSTRKRTNPCTSFAPGMRSRCLVQYEPHMLYSFRKQC